MVKHFFSKQFILFLLTGGFAAIVNFVSRIIFNHWVSFSAAIVLAYLTGMVTAFLLARWFVFKQSQQSFARSALIFSAINVIAIIQTWLVSMGMVMYLLPYWGIEWHPAELAHATGVVVPVFTSYLGHKLLSFR